MIHVIDNWYIEPDELNWQSFEYKASEKGAKKGVKSKRNINYHHTLYRAMLRIKEDCKRKSLNKIDCEYKDAIHALISEERRCESEITKTIQIAVKENKGSKMA